MQDIAEEAVALGGQDTDPEPDSVDQFGFLRGSSKSMRKLYRLIRKVAQSDASLMALCASGLVESGFVVIKAGPISEGIR